MWLLIGSRTCTTHLGRAPCRDVTQHSALPLMTQRAPRYKGGSGSRRPLLVSPNGRVPFYCCAMDRRLLPPPDKSSCANDMSVNGRCALLPLALTGSTINSARAASPFFPPEVALYV